MARSHHRKKHKEHVRQFRHQQDTATRISKTKTTGIFTFIGAALGFAISYFAVQGSYIWMAVGIAAGAVIGYYIGRNIDSDKT